MKTSTELEIITITLTQPLYIAAFSTLSDNLIFNFLYLIIPQYIVIQRPDLIPLTHGLAIAVILIHLCFRYFVPAVPSKFSPNLYFDMERSILIIQTTIAILLCDFSFWIERFGKTETFGITLMDMGLVGFVFNTAMTSSRADNYKILKRLPLLLSLGFVRILTVKLFGLEVNPKEYGIHWNAYFTLTAVPLIFCVIRSRYNLAVGCILLLGNEFLLQWTESWIMSDDRSNFILQNKEGISSVIPFVGMFLILNEIGSVLLSRRTIMRKIVCGIFYLEMALSVYCISGEASRRLTNLAFISWAMTLQMGNFVVALLLMRYLPFCVGEMKLLKFVCRNMMAIFLVSNLLVLLFKQVFVMERMAVLEGNVLNVGYLVILYIIFPLIHTSKIK